ncbi:MAG: DUF4907 domain-containing protein [Planctomycetia bacterium]
MYEVEVYQHGGGYGFRVSTNGSACVLQPFDPNQPGDTPMSQARAAEAGAAVVARIEASVAEVVT